MRAATLEKWQLNETTPAYETAYDPEDQVLTPPQGEIDPSRAFLNQLRMPWVQHWAAAKQPESAAHE